MPESTFFIINTIFISSTYDNQIIKQMKNNKKCGTLHDFACHPCAGAMLIFSVSFQF